MQKGFARLVVIVILGIVLLFIFRIISEHFLGINPIKFGSASKQSDSSNNSPGEMFQGAGAFFSQRYR